MVLPVLAMMSGSWDQIFIGMGLNVIAACLCLWNLYLAARKEKRLKRLFITLAISYLLFILGFVPILVIVSYLVVCGVGIRVLFFDK